jgi:hypothetical protein
MHFYFEGTGEGFKVHISVKWSSLNRLLHRLIILLSVVAALANIYTSQIIV